MTLFEALTGGAFYRLNWQYSGEFDQNFSKKSNAPGFFPGGMGGFGIDRYITVTYTPNAIMADHSVVARDELHESEVSQSLMFCFDIASLEKSCFVVDLFCFISLCL